MKLYENMKSMKKTHTRGNVIVEDIKVGDVHYEYEFNFCIKVMVKTEPALNEHGQWEWTSETVKTGKEVEYLVDPKYAHYSSKLYDYEAYSNITQL